MIQLFTSKQNVDEIIYHQEHCRTNTIQLCDRPENGAHKKLNHALPGIKIVQVVHVADEDSIYEAVDVSQFVGAILLDSGNQKLEVKELGGTHDWQISRRIRELVQVPLFLAGGLNFRNVAEAINKVNPFGIDVCSGVRTNGKLDEQKLKLFFEQVKTLDKFN